MMRAKMVVASVSRNKMTEGPEAGKTCSERVYFRPVCKREGYDSTGLDENNTFAKYTPNGEAFFDILNPALFDKFENGQEFYVDFTPVAK